MGIKQNQDFELKKTKISEESLKERISSSVLSNKTIMDSLPEDTDKGQAIHEAISSGLRGNTSPLYENIKSHVRETDALLSSQIKTHQVGFKHSTKTESFNNRANDFQLKREKEKDKTPNKKVRNRVKISSEGIELTKEETKLHMGERNTKQKLIYQSIHQPMKKIADNWNESEGQEGNEGIQLAHSSASKLKEQVLKPFVRKHTPVGFDRHQYKEQKLHFKETKSRAKSSFQQKYSESRFSDNTIKKQYQKARMKKRIYQEHGLKVSAWQRTKNIFAGTFRFIDPFRRIRETWATISASVSAMGLLLKMSMFALIFVIVLIVPAIVISNIFSIFFGWGDSDPNVAVAQSTEYFTKEFTSLTADLRKADRQESCNGINDFPCDYRPLDEVRLDEASLRVQADKQIKIQVEAIGLISALHQYKMTQSNAEGSLKEMLETLYLVEQRYVNEPITETIRDPITGETTEIEHDYWVLYLSLKQTSMTEVTAYVDSKIDSLPDDQRELAKLQMSNYRETYGLGQVLYNPFGEGFNWINSISSPFGYRNNPFGGIEPDFHHGLDIGMPGGTPLYSACDGSVERADFNSIEGNRVYLECRSSSGDVWYVKYLHQSSLAVSKGQSVSKGDVIGAVGTTGSSTGNHLHIQIEVGRPFSKKYINPFFVLQSK